MIKNLGEALGRMPEIASSAIMADGRVGLIVDVGGFEVRMSQDVDVLSCRAYDRAVPR
ncbi:MAG: hypothetical protein U0527_09345 [Candidatus Eisenbacteria bacterium]